MTFTPWKFLNKRLVGNGTTTMMDTTAIMMDTTALMGGSNPPTVWKFTNKHS